MEFLRITWKQGALTIIGILLGALLVAWFMVLRSPSIGQAGMGSDANALSSDVRCDRQGPGRPVPQEGVEQEAFRTLAGRQHEEALPIVHVDALAFPLLPQRGSVRLTVFRMAKGKGSTVRLESEYGFDGQSVVLAAALIDGEDHGMVKGGFNEGRIRLAGNATVMEGTPQLLCSEAARQILFMHALAGRSLESRTPLKYAGCRWEWGRIAENEYVFSPAACVKTGLGKRYLPGKADEIDELHLLLDGDRGCAGVHRICGVMGSADEETRIQRIELSFAPRHPPISSDAR